DGIQTSTRFYRFGRALESVGLQNYRDALDDPEFTGAVWTTLKFVALAVSLETVLGLGLALLCARELRYIRWARVALIVPMIVTPVVVGIVFRLVYASDVGMLSSISQDLGGGQIGILDQDNSAFLGLVALDVWEWTPLMFLIILAGLQSLPVEP